jgi:hypothetical protein
MIRVTVVTSWAGAACEGALDAGLGALAADFVAGGGASGKAAGAGGRVASAAAVRAPGRRAGRLLTAAATPADAA